MTVARLLRVAVLAAAATLILAAPASATLAFTTGFGSEGNGPGQFTTPSGIAVDPAGNVWVADQAADQVQEFAADGTYLMGFGTPGTSPGQFTSPVGVATDPLGNVYVTDASRVQKFDQGGAYIESWGTPGTGDGQFQGAGGIAVNFAGSVFVVDTGGSRVEQFTSDGAFQGEFPVGAASPTAIAVNSSGQLYVASSDDTVRVFSATGVPQADLTWGTAGTDDGEFTGIGGLAAVDGSVFATDGGGRLQVFSDDGAFLELAGSGGGGPSQLAGPLGVAASTTGDVYVADAANHRVQHLLYSTLPPPVLGVSINASRESGQVTVQPAGRRRAIPLRTAAQLKVGSTIDATRGTVRVVSARNRSGGTQSAKFYEGAFVVTQKRSSALTDLQLTGGKPCPVTRRRSVGARTAGANSAPAAVRRKRRAWGNGHCRCRTKGGNSATTSHGTIWLTQDRCDGTLTKVTRGEVTVFDYTTRRTVTVRAGEQYLARYRGA